jgi:hypothetical protein
VKEPELIAGCIVSVSEDGVLLVQVPSARIISVLPRGTRAALDELGADAKRQIVDWWKAQP